MRFHELSFYPVTCTVPTQRPKILVLATGGTIAGVATAAATDAGYRAGVLDVASLLASVPGIEDLAELSSAQPCNIDSKDLDPALWTELALRVRRWRDDGGAGCVICHGTDSLEETAYALHCLLPPGPPVVLTAAMLPATALSADGPRNLYDAVRVAIDAHAAGRGVLCVLHGTVHGARDVSKVHAPRVDAFDSGPRGPLGLAGGDGVRFTRVDPRAVTVPLATPTRWPRVELVCSHAGADGAVVRALLVLQQAGELCPPLAGLVAVGTGGGTVHAALQDALDDAVAAGVRVLVAPRHGVIDGGPYDGLNAVKLRVRLLLELAQAASPH